MYRVSGTKAERAVTWSKASFWFILVFFFSLNNNITKHLFYVKTFPKEFSFYVSGFSIDIRNIIVEPLIWTTEFNVYTRTTTIAFWILLFFFRTPCILYISSISSKIILHTKKIKGLINRLCIFIGIALQHWRGS